MVNWEESIYTLQKVFYQEPYPDLSDRFCLEEPDEHFAFEFTNNNLNFYSKWKREKHAKSRNLEIFSGLENTKLNNNYILKYMIYEYISKNNLL